MNQCILTGYLGSDPTYKTFDNGGAVANARLADTHRWTDKTTHETKEKTSWFSLVFNNELANTAQSYLHKGSRILVQAQARTREWTDNDNRPRSITEFVVQRLEFLDNNKKERDEGLA